MNKKLLKSIVCVVSGVAIATSIPFTATSCGNNSGNNDCIEFKSPKEFANYNFNSWQDKLGIDCHKDYTYGGKYTSSEDFEYTKNITTDLRKQESCLKYFLCLGTLGEFVYGYVTELSPSGTDLRTYSRSDVDNFLLNSTSEINNFSMKITYPKNIKWSEVKDERGDLCDVVTFSSFSACMAFNGFKLELSFIDNVPIIFSSFRSSSYQWSEKILNCTLKSFDNTKTIATINTPDGSETRKTIEFSNVYTSKSDQIFNQSGDSKFATE